MSDDMKEQDSQSIIKEAEHHLKKTRSLTSEDRAQAVSEAKDIFEEAKIAYRSKLKESEFNQPKNQFAPNIDELSAIRTAEAIVKNTTEPTKISQHAEENRQLLKISNELSRIFLTLNRENGFQKLWSKVIRQKIVTQKESNQQFMYSLVIGKDENQCNYYMTEIRQMTGNTPGDLLTSSKITQEVPHFHNGKYITTLTKRLPDSNSAGDYQIVQDQPQKALRLFYDCYRQVTPTVWQKLRNRLKSNKKST